jgi:hypothetical protein
MGLWARPVVRLALEYLGFSLWAGCCVMRERTLLGCSAVGTVYSDEIITSLSGTIDAEYHQMALGSALVHKRELLDLFGTPGY